MNLESQKAVIHQNQQQLFEFLSDMNNYEQLMPDSTQHFSIHESGQGFMVKIGALPEVGMKLKTKQEHSQIIFESPTSNFDYNLTVNLNALGESKTEVGINFDGTFNPMIEMMAKSPLQNFINTIVQKLESNQ